MSKVVYSKMYPFLSEIIVLQTSMDIQQMTRCAREDIALQTSDRNTSFKPGVVF